MTTTPKRRWPAEWEPHRATWLSWPHNRETWPTHLARVEDAFCEMVRQIAPGEDVEINVGGAALADHVHEKLRGAGIRDFSRIRLHDVATNDAWVRDHGAIFVFEQAEGGARRAALDFLYDAWGGKYPPWNLDERVAEQMARIAGVPRIAFDLVLEAGGIDGDGAGTILTTESCLLNPNRDRPGHDRSRGALERVLGEAFGAEKVLWLGDGIEGDDTDGHVDDLTRFVAEGRVVTIVERNPSDSNYRVLRENRERLEGMLDARGRRLEVIELPTPGVVPGPDGRLPASYANFYFANAAVLVPVFDRDEDREAISILEKAIPDRPIVPIPGQNLVLGLGAVHCLTQQEPSGPH
ncbi:MAG: agmatine deiminase family protein [Deltaproteobacteria bacterium]|nr:agmatine deiminase family protein [Deltaproteobacteria bacterium]